MDPTAQDRPVQVISTQGQTPKQSSFSLGKVLLALVIIIIVSAAIAAAYWYFVIGRTSSNNLPNESTNTASPSATQATKYATTSAKKVDTSDWKTYTSKLGVFEIKYPKTFVIKAYSQIKGSKDSIASGVIYPFETFYLTIPGDSESHVRIYVNGYWDSSCSEFCTTKQIDFAGRKAQLTIDKSSGESKFYSIRYKNKVKNEVVVAISEFSSKKSTIKLFDQILSTFKFLD